MKYLIIVRLKGALGNQMFEYAFGRALSIKHGVPLKLDISGLKSVLHNYSFDLGHLNIQCEIASENETSKFTKRSLIGLTRLMTDRLRAPHKRYVLTESSYSFLPDLLHARNKVYIQGYWQSEKYFKNVENIIKEELTVKNPLEGKNLQLANEMQNCNSISLHVRRGDYVNIKEVTKIHGICSLDYFERAVIFMADKVDKPCFYIFSDDMEWVESNLKIDFPMTLVNHNGSNIEHDGTDKCYEDIRLMSQCRHNIISNSTFSWWGAWLNNNNNKIVCAPKVWALDKALNTPDRVPLDWIRL